MPKHTLPDLPYAKNALEPHISEETLNYHYGKHHATYVDKLNAQTEGTEFADASLEEIIKKANGGIFNNGAQVWNHTFYWNCLSPTGGGEPDGELAEKLVTVFGSVSDFKEQFNAAATNNFGSGWTWLCASGADGLEVVNTDDADNPMRIHKTPLLTCDMWEHAYYIDHRNSRPQYLQAFWNLVNWDFVAGNYSLAAG